MVKNFSSSDNITILLGGFFFSVERKKEKTPCPSAMELCSLVLGQGPAAKVVLIFLLNHSLAAAHPN